jgi:hypothetical protein
MRTKLLAIAAILTLAAISGAQSQQASGQDDRAAASSARQTTSASGTTSGSPPEQAGDLYQVRTPANGNFVNPATHDDLLPGALSPGMEPLGGDKQAEPKE